MILMARKNGRLANRLVLTAHLAAFSAEHGVRVVNPTLDEYADLFEKWDRDLWGRIPPRRSLIPATPFLRRGLYTTIKAMAYGLRRFWPRGPFHEVVDIGIDTPLDLSDPEFVARARRKVVLTMGWLFRDNAATLRHAEMLRELLRPTETHRREAESAASRARQEADMLVGVHIRHGDYKTFLGGRYYYSLEQYRGFMEQMRDLLPERRVAFLICSDAKHDLAAFGDLDVHPGPGRLASDLLALSHCDYIIGPRSTYSYWASFYGNRPLLHIESSDQRIDLSSFRTANLSDPDTKEGLSQ